MASELGFQLTTVSPEISRPPTPPLQVAPIQSPSSYPAPMTIDLNGASLDVDHPNRKLESRS